MTADGLAADVVIARRNGFRLDVAVAVAAGEVVAVMGPSGAGKSTLLLAIAGLERLTAGRIVVGARMLADAAASVHVPPARRGVVLLGQQPRLFPHLTARENVAFGLRAHGAPRRDARGAADDWLGRVGLDGAGPQRPTELSGGQQQRVALARALATKPGLVLLDEPLTALDPQTEAELRTLLHDELSATGSTAVIVTHDALDAAALSSRLVVLDGGRIVEEGATAAVLREPGTDFAAAAADLNRVPGRVRGGQWRADAGGMRVPVPADVADGPAVAAFRPTDVRLATDEPGPSTASTWACRLERLERHRRGVRLRTGPPTADVDVGADVVAALELRPGETLRLRIDPAAVRVYRAP